MKTRDSEYVLLIVIGAIAVILVMIYPEIMELIQKLDILSEVFK